jgi:hypothetical protein
MKARGGHKTFRRPFGALCALVLGVSLAAGFAGGASATTQPGFSFTLQVNMTDAQVTLVPKKSATGKLLSSYIRDGGHSAQFPRGVIITFKFVNHGTKVYLPAIRVLDKSQANPYSKTKALYTANPIGPGHQALLFGNFYFRGSFQIEQLLNKKPHGQPVALSIY